MICRDRSVVHAVSQARVVGEPAHIRAGGALDYRMLLHSAGKGLARPGIVLVFSDKQRARQSLKYVRYRGARAVAASGFTKNPCPSGETVVNGLLAHSFRDCPAAPDNSSVLRAYCTEANVWGCILCCVRPSKL